MTWFAVHARNGLLVSAVTKGRALDELASTYDVAAKGTKEGEAYRVVLDNDGDYCSVGRESVLRELGFGWVFDGEQSPVVNADEGYEFREPQEILPGDILRLAGKLAEPVLKILGWVDHARHRYLRVIVLDGAAQRTLFLFENVSYLTRRPPATTKEVP